MHKTWMAIGLIIIAAGILQTPGLFGTTLTTIVSGSGCGSWTLNNPSSQSQSSGTQWASGQLELLSEKYTPNFGTACSFDPAYATFEVIVQCLSGCGSGTTYATLNCASCYPGLNAAQATQDSSGNVNLLWGTAATNGVFQTGTSGYPVGAVIQVTYRAFIIASGTHTADALSVYGTFIAGITGQAYDFQLAPSQTSLSFGAGSTGTISIGVTPLNGYPGPTSLSVSCSSTALTTCTIAPTSITNGQSATLTLGGSIAGLYTVQVTGSYTSSSGNLVHSLPGAGISATVTSSGSGSGTPDFTITASANLLVFPVGSSATATLTFTSFNGFNGGITVSSTQPNGANGGCTLSGTSVTLTQSAPTATLIVTLTAFQAGTFTCTITGVSGSLTHALSVLDLSTLTNPGSFPVYLIFLVAGTVVFSYGVYLGRVEKKAGKD